MGKTGIACLIALVIGCAREDPKPPVPAGTAEPEPVRLVAPKPAPAGCSLTVPRSRTLDPLLFPTLDGATEFDNGISNRESNETLSLIAKTNLAYDVPRLTKCSVISTETRDYIDYAKVRVLGGNFAGRIGWLPEIQTKGM